MSQGVLWIFSLDLTEQSGQFPLVPSVLLAYGQRRKKKKIKKIELLTEYFLKYILEFLYYSKGQKTVPCWPNLTLYTFVYGHLCLSYGQKKIFYRVFCNTWKLFEIQSLMLTIKTVLGHSHFQPFTYHLWMLLHTSIVWDVRPTV